MAVDFSTAVNAYRQAAGGVTSGKPAAPLIGEERGSECRKGSWLPSPGWSPTR